MATKKKNYNGVNYAQEVLSSIREGKSSGLSSAQELSDYVEKTTSDYGKTYASYAKQNYEEKQKRASQAKDQAVLFPEEANASVNAITGQYNKAVSEYNARSAVQQSASSQTGKMLADNIKGAKRTAQLSSGQSKSNALAAAEEYQNEQSRRTLATKDSVVDKATMEADLQNAQESVRRANLQLEQAKTTEEKSAAVARYEQAVKTMNKAKAAAMDYDAQARYVMENASEETGKALTQELADLNAEIKQQKAKADKMLNAGDTDGYKAALANVQDSDAARKAARIQELIEINDYYKNKSNVITGMSDDEFSSYYAGYSEAENNASAHEDKAQQYRKEADKALAAGDSSAYLRLIGSANAEQQAAEQARAQYADVDAQAKYTIETRASISSLESAAKSDRNAQRYIDIGAKSDWTPKLRDAVTNMMSQVGFSKQAEILMDQMTDTEKKVLQYYLGKNDTKSAQTYFSALEPTLESRNMESVNQAAQEHPVMGLIANTAYNALQITGGTTLLGAAITAENVMNSGNGEYSPPLSNTMLGGTASATRSGTASGIANAFLSDKTKQMMEDAAAMGTADAAVKYGMTEQEFTEKLQDKQKSANFWAGQIVSISENVARNIGGRLSVGSSAKQLSGRGLSEEAIKAATRVDEWVPLILMGSGVATDTIQEKLQSGEPAWKAVIYGGIVGGAETLTEKMGLDEWLKVSTGNFSSTMLGQFVGKNGIVNRAGIRNYVQTALGLANQALSEGGEEVVSSLVDGIADIIINQDNSELMVSMRQYILDGYSDAEAESLAWRDWANEVGESFLGGAVSGGILGAFSIPSQLKYNNAIGQGVLDSGIQNAYALIEAGTQYAEDTETYRLAKQMEQARDASQDYTPSAAALTDLALAMEQDSKTTVSTLDVAGANSNVLSATASGLISDRLVTATEAQTMDKVLGKVAAGETVTDAEIRTLHAERGGVQAKLSEILGVQLENGSTGAVRAAIQEYQRKAGQASAQADAVRDSKEIIREAEPYARQQVLSESAAEVEGARAAGEAAAVQDAMNREQSVNDLAAAQAEGDIARIDRDTEPSGQDEDAIPYAFFEDQYRAEHPNAESEEVRAAFDAANAEAKKGGAKAEHGTASFRVDADGAVYLDGVDSPLTYDDIRKAFKDETLSDDVCEAVLNDIRNRAEGGSGVVRYSVDDVQDIVGQTASENGTVEIGSVEPGQYSKEQPNKVMEWLAQDAKRIFGDMGIQDISVDYEMSASENGCFKVDGGKPKIVLNGQLGDTTRDGVYYTAQDNIVFVIGHEIGHQAQGEDAGSWTDTIIQSYMDVNRGFSAEELETRITRTMEKYRNLAVLEKLRGNDIGLKPSDVTRDYARTEVACDMLGEMMRDYNLIGRMKPEHRNLFQRVCDRVAEVRENLSKLVKRKLNLDRGKSVGIQECYETAAESIEVMLRDALQAAELRGGAVSTEEGNRYSIDEKSGLYLSDADIQNGIREVAGMEPVASLTGEEFKKGEVDLVTQVSTFFDEIGNSVHNEQLGDIILDRRSVKDDISHGIGRKKAVAFAAVPDVLRDGKVIDFQEDWKGRGYQTAVVSAPIYIGEEKYFVGAVVSRNDGETRFYVHEVLAVEQKEGQAPFKTGTSQKSGTPGGDYPSILSLLQKVSAVNPSENDSGARFSIDAIEEARAEDERFRAEQRAEAARLNREARAAEKAGDAERAASLRAEAADAKLMGQTDYEMTMEAAKNAGVHIPTEEEAAKIQAEQEAKPAEKKFSEMTPDERIAKIVQDIMNRNNPKPKQKVSQAYLNTLVGGGILTQAQTEIEGLRAEDMEYDVESEKETLSAAADRVNKNYMKWYNELPGKAGWSNVDLDTAMLIMGQLQKESRQSGNTAEVVRWAKVLQEHETFGGKFMQSIKKWTRTSAYLVAKATDTLDIAYINEKGDNKALKNLKKENGKKFDELDAQVKKNETLDAENKKLQEQLNQIIQEQDQLKAEEAELKDEKSELLKDKRDAKNELAKLIAREQKLNDSIAKLQDDINKTMDKLQDRQAEVHGLSAENSEVLKQKHRLERRLETANNRYEREAERNKDLKDAMRAMTENNLTPEQIRAIAKTIRERNQFMEKFITVLADQKTAANRANLKAGQTSSASGRKNAATQTANQWVNEQNGLLQDDLDKVMTTDRKAKIISDMSKFANTLDAMEEGDKEGVVEQILEMAKLRGHEQKEKTRILRRNQYEKTKKDLMAQDWQYLHDFAKIQLANIADDYVKRSAGEKASAWQFLAQLLNVRTSGRNIFSNAAFYVQEGMAKNVGAVIDMGLGKLSQKAAGLKTSQRTVGFSTMRRGDEGRIQGAKEWATRSALETRLDVSMSDKPGKYGQSSSRTFKKVKAGISGGVMKVLSNMEMINGYSLNVTDQFFKGAVYNATINSYASLVEHGHLTQEEAEQFAAQQVLYNTFQDDTLIGTALNMAHNGLNYVSDMLIKDIPVLKHLQGFGLGDFIVKYRTVPGALVTRSLEYSPIGLLKSIQNICTMVEYGRKEANINNEFKATGKMNDAQMEEVHQKFIKAQHDASMGLARCATGSGLIAAFWLLAFKGLLKRNEDEDDLDARAMNTAAGMSGTQLNLSALRRFISGEAKYDDETGDILWDDGDSLIDLGFLDPLGSTMTMGTMIAKSMKENGEEWYKTVLPANLGMAKAAFSDLSMMDTINDLFYTLSYHDENSDLSRGAEFCITFATSMATSMIPSLLRQAAQGIDPYYRDTYGGSGPIYDAIGGDTGKALQQAANEIAVNIPGLRQTIPTKLNSFGEERTYQGNEASRLVDAMLKPWKSAKYNQSEAERALRMLYSSTGDASVYPDRNAPSSIQFGDERVKLTPDQKRQYLTTAGQLYQSMMGELMSSDVYDAANNMERVEMLNDMKSYASYKAKQELYSKTHSGNTYEDSKWNKTEAGMELGLSFGEMREILKDTGSIESLKDEDGKTIEGSIEGQIMDYLNDLEQSDDTKLELYGIIRGSGAESSTQKLREIMNSGLTFQEATDVRKFFNELNNSRDDNADGMKDRDVFEKYLRDNGYTEAQREIINERYRFFTQIPQDQNSTITKLLEDGMDYDTAYGIAGGLASLEPEDGSDSVSSAQKYDQIIGDSSLSNSEKQAAIAAANSDIKSFAILDSDFAGRLMDAYEQTGNTLFLSGGEPESYTINGVSSEYTEAELETWRGTYSAVVSGISSSFDLTATYTNSNGNTSYVYDKIKNCATAYGRYKALEQSHGSVTDEMVSGDSNDTNGLSLGSKVNGAIQRGVTLEQYAQTYAEVQQIRYNVSDGEADSIRSYLKSQYGTGDLYTYMAKCMGIQKP